MSARHWPCLNNENEGGVLPNVGTDFGRWTWEGDQSDDVIKARAESGALGTNSGQHFWQVIRYQNSVKCDLC